MLSEARKNKMQWDKVTDCFTVDKDNPSKHILANLLLTWPAIEATIENYANERTLNILDYGCGTGGLSKILSLRGHRVTGIDVSANMITAARTNNTDRQVRYLVGDYRDVIDQNPFDLIVASMVFQFIEDIEELFYGLAKLQPPGQILLAAVHNPNYVKTSVAANRGLFQNFENGIPGSGLINIGDKEIIPIYIRDDETYKKSSLPHYKLVETVLPKYSEEYLSHFPDEIASVPRIQIFMWCRT